jgi:hypothetical protein
MTLITLVIAGEVHLICSLKGLFTEAQVIVTRT